MKIMHRLLLIFCLMTGVVLSAADTLQKVKIIPWAYKNKSNDRPFFLLHVVDEQMLYPFSFHLSDGSDPCEISKKNFNIRKSSMPFVIKDGVILFPRVSYRSPMRVDFKEINSTWINAIRLYDMVNKGKKAFSRDGSRYELSKDLFEYLKRFQLYFE